MDDVQAARLIAQRFLDELAPPGSEERLAIDDRGTTDAGWCWVFVYNTTEYLETGNFSTALVGNGPIAVDKATGAVHHLITGRPIPEQLSEIQRANRRGT